jgi:hypothetical protein
MLTEREQNAASTKGIAWPVKHWYRCYGTDLSFATIYKSGQNSDGAQNSARGSRDRMTSTPLVLFFFFVKVDYPDSRNLT